MPIGPLSISSLVQSLFGIGTPRLPDASETSKAAANEQATPQPSPGAPPAKALDIAARYDVRRISTREFSSLLRELRDAGFLNEADFVELGRLRTELEQSGAAPDEPIDLLQWAQRQLADHRSRSAELPPTDDPLAQRRLALEEQTRLQTRLGWLEKLAALHDRDAELLELDRAV